jgi:hypothetical protein
MSHIERRRDAVHALVGLCDADPLPQAADNGPVVVAVAATGLLVGGEGNW